MKPPSAPQPFDPQALAREMGLMEARYLKAVKNKSAGVLTGDTRPEQRIAANRDVYRAALNGKAVVSANTAAKGAAPDEEHESTQAEKDERMEVLQRQQELEAKAENFIRSMECNQAIRKALKLAGNDPRVESREIREELKLYFISKGALRPQRLFKTMCARLAGDSDPEAFMTRALITIGKTFDTFCLPDITRQLVPEKPERRA
ncbi:hypothetical protein HZA43_04115 [Candidatus Peregrinibacteria bacterium]|nr:hypothetical protein [Candidatus Peregrinibacteria bacterium]